jgi:putative ABC transport system permease protein
MLKNYLKIALRNIKRNKIYSLINILGLSIGLACCMLISFYLYHETHYDAYHTKGDRIYQMATIFINGKKQDPGGNTPSPMATVLQQEYPEIEDATRVIKMFLDDKSLLRVEEGSKQVKSIYESNGFLADPNFFNLFTYNFKAGNPLTALKEPNSIVLSEETSKKLFGEESPMNETIHISSNTNGDYVYKVTGVFSKGSYPSHIDGKFFVSMNGGNVEKYFIKGVTSLSSNNMFYTYLLLKPGTDAQKLESKFPAFVEKYIRNELKTFGFDKKQYLIPLKKIHLHSEMKENVTPTASVTYLFILGSIAVLTLLIACINFMNLSTARSSKRSAEVGVRKVLGANQQSLIGQFLGESIVMALIAFIIGLLCAELLLPSFGNLAGKDFNFSFQQQLSIGLFFLILSLFTGLIAGSYPAFYLSSFRPILVLKGKFSNSLAAVSLRKGLVIFQFAISIVLIISSIIIAKQMSFVRSKDLGFAQEQQIVIPLRTSTSKNIYSALKDELSKNPNIISTGASSYYPGIFNPSDISFYKEGLTAESARRVYLNNVDESLLQTLEIESITGRLFSKEFPADTANKILLNEEAVKQLQFKSNQGAIGKTIAFDWKGEHLRWQIIGVVKDFHFKDLHLPIEPFGFFLGKNYNFNYVIAHARKTDMHSVLKQIESSWHKLNPNEPFEFSFLDQDFQKNYQAENRLLTIVGDFTLIAIFISCLGLFGLATFSAEQRIKEIGVRKVLGASVSNIVTLMSKDFLKLVMVSILLASPIAWYIMNKWLNDFEYKIDIEWWVFVVTGVLAVTIAFVTISYQAISAAIANPVKSLRTE